MSSTAVTWIVIGVIVVLVLWIITIYNGLVAMRQRVNQAFSDIDVQTKQRHDLVPNLVETVKGYAGHERGTLEAVVQRGSSVRNPWPRFGATSGSLHSLHAIRGRARLSVPVVHMTTSLMLLVLMEWGHKSITTLRRSTFG
jgi:hypothetical protein